MALRPQQDDGRPKYVVCNADEGDPGAFMDRSVLEGDPHRVIEGMVIAAYAIGAHQGYIYVRAEYPLAVERLENALGQAREYGLLGKNILGSGFDFDLEIRMGSGAFVCGEETALMTSIEGNRGEPRPRPPFPAVKGLWGKPSVLNNVETYANVPAIILKGGGVVRQQRHREQQGHQGLRAGRQRAAHRAWSRCPIGMPLGELIYDIGGGIPERQGVQGRPDRRPLGRLHPQAAPQRARGLRVALQELGAIMGSGGLIVMDEDSCMVDVARFFLEFVQEESCGKCVPCRVGTKRMLEILKRICEGQGEEGDVERLIDLGEMISRPSLCGLGQTAPNPVLSTIRHFRHEYEAHIRDKHCRAGVCPAHVQGALLQRLPGQRRHPRLRVARGREALRRGAAAAPRAQPVRRPSAPASASTPARTSAARRASTRPSRSAASSASWSSRR